MRKNVTPIGCILKYLRKDRELIQKDLCSLLHITEQAYSNYETGKRMPDTATLIQLANFYQIDFSLFLAVILNNRKPHAMSVDTFILLDRFQNLPASDQRDILFYTKMKARTGVPAIKDSPQP